MKRQFRIYPKTRVAKNGAKLPYFTVWYYDDAGKRRNKDVPVEHQSEEDAERWFLFTFLAQKKTEAKTVEPIRGNKTFAGLADWWTGYLKDAKRTREGMKIDESTRRQLEGLFTRWVLDCDGVEHASIQDLDLETGLDAQTINGWIDSIRDHVSSYHLRNIIAAARTFIRDARMQKKITLASNPFTDELVEAPHGERLAGKDVYVAFPRDEAAALVHAAKLPADRRIKYLLGFLTGARDAELHGFKWSDVDLNAEIPLLKVERQLKRYTDRAKAAQFKPPKKKSYRTIPIHPQLAKALKAWQETGWEAFTGRKPTTHDPILPDRHGYHCMPRSARLLRGDLTANGLPTKYMGEHDYTIHAMRRAFATMLADAGVEPGIRDALMGHAGKTVGDRHYVARNPERFYAAVCKLDLAATRKTKLRVA